MPQNCTAVTLTDVIKFFVEDIDGMGKHDGYPRNSDTPAMLEASGEWKFCELTKEEFLHLIIPDGTNTLIKDKDLDDVEGEDSINTVQRYLERLKNNENIPHLIVRNKLLNNSPKGSYYIEDGAHRAIAFKVYFGSSSYRPVTAYIGWRKN